MKMPVETPDERLKRLGREWFAEVRAKNPEPVSPVRRSDASDSDAGPFEWLFDRWSDDSGSDGDGD
jgi:hypothetical protein